jgi:hypothetical protein
MADVREVFPILEDGSNVGAVLTKSQAGDSSSGKVGLTGFTFRDSSGNLVLPQLTAAGKIAVDAGASASGTCKSAQGTNAGSLSNVTLGTITLTASKVISDIEAQIACSRSALAEVVWNDDGAETILGWIMTGPGQFTAHLDINCLTFTSGSTGTQQILFRAKNLDKAASLYGTVAVLEAP